MPGLEVPLSDGTAPSLRWLNADDLNGLAVDGPPVFLGLQDGRAHFAVYVPKTDGAAEELTSDKSIVFSDARRAATILALQETGIVAQARAQLDWHNRHGFCSVCGAPTEMGRGGHVRQCPECNAQHFPRTDPVTIMLVLDQADNVLLGRQPRFPPGVYSALAGFVEPGENIEEAVRRECEALS